MNWWYELKYLIRKLNRRRAEQEAEEEIQTHLELETREKIEGGHSPEEAWYAARRAFGNVVIAKEQSRAIWGFGFLETLFQDLRYGVRMLQKNPGFTVIAVLTLALGIGMNTALFSILNAVVLRPMPLKNPESVVRVYRKVLGESRRDVSGSNSLFTYQEYTDHRDNTQSFSGLTAYYSGGKYPMTLGGAEPEEVTKVFVAGNYFSVLEAEMALGRSFAPDEGHSPGSSPVVVLSHSFWQRRFGSDPRLVGKTLTLNRQPFTVIGITAPDFYGTGEMVPDLWMPLTMHDQVIPGENLLANQYLSRLEVIGRLKPGVSLAQAQAEVTLSAGQRDLANPGQKTQIILTRGSFRSDPFRLDQERGAFVLIMTAVSLVLLIACANVANLSLARAATRQKEIAVRLSLGASRLRLVRQLLTESVLIAILGGASGLLLVYLIVSVLITSSELNRLPFILNLQPDLRVFGYTLLVSIVTGRSGWHPRCNLPSII